VTRLAGRRAVITGAARGIGYAIAERFATEGAAVALVDVQAEQLKEAAGTLGAPAVDEAAVIELTRVAAMELGPLGITVNCICPGYVLTEMGAATRTPEMVAAWTAKSRLGRLASPEDVAAMALFLVSADSDYCTGQAMNVTGGMIMH
jgi:NAD(P)-dependent dehydrogenase (short-subunit alcohol dehydrogenase family)